MTPTQKRLAEMVPEMPDLIPQMTDDTAQQVINLIVQTTIAKEEKKKKEDAAKEPSIRIGVGKGRFKAPDDLDENGDEAVAMLERYALS